MKKINNSYKLLIEVNFFLKYFFMTNTFFKDIKLYTYFKIVSINDKIQVYEL